MKDLGWRVERLQAIRRGEDDPSVPRGAAEHLFRVADHLSGAADALPCPDAVNEPPWEALRRAVLAAYPDRVARRRAPGEDRGVMVGGVGVRLERGAIEGGSELMVCVDLLRRGRDAEVGVAVSIEPQWLEGPGLREVDECFFHPTARRVVGRRRRYWWDLVLAETPTEVIDDAQAAELLAEEAIRQWERAFPEGDPAVAGFLARVRCLAQWMPELQLPALDLPTLQSLARSLCRGRRSLEELRQAPWVDHLRGLLSYDQQVALDRHAPARIEVPSGNRLAIEYSADAPPVLAVRLQELFGWHQTPRIAGGRVPLRLHLLGPNHRPQQVTEDLASFWRTTYADVRKELRRRYPKHHWPEDPTAARATRSGLGRDAAGE